MKAFQDKNIQVLQWPGNSPDVNPIENLWAIVKKRLQNHDCTSKTKLISAIIKIWYHDEELKNMCSTLVDFMSQRVQCTLKAKGGHIKC